MSTSVNIRNKRRRLFDLQGGTCPYCRQPMMDPDYVRERGLSMAPTAPTLEHVKPKGHGGRNVLENLLLVHAHCNETRDTKRIPHHAERVRQAVLEAVKDLRATKFASPQPEKQP